MTVDVSTFLGVPGAPVRIVEHTTSPNPSPALVRLSELAPWLTVERAPCEEPPCPRTRIQSDRPQGRITFIGPIERRELEPLVEVLRALATGDVDYDTPATPQLLAKLVADVRLTVAITPICPFCPAVTAATLRLACASPHVSVEVVRADLATGRRFTSTPTVVVNETVVAEGPVSEATLVDAVLTSSRS